MPRDRTPVQTMAMLVAIVFLLVGILGFIPGITSNFSDITFAGNESDAKLLGIFQTSTSSSASPASRWRGPGRERGRS